MSRLTVMIVQGYCLFLNEFLSKYKLHVHFSSCHPEKIKRCKNKNVLGETIYGHIVLMHKTFFSTLTHL